MQRIVIIGSSCSGKTTLAKQLATRFGCLLLELDAYFWLPGWRQRPDEDFRRNVAEALVGDRWVVDGNYVRIGDLVWGQADTIIWLRFPFPVVYMRLIMRTIGRLVRRELLWGTNRESLRSMLFERDSLLYWVPANWRRTDRKLAERTAAVASTKTVLEFRSPKQLAAWLAAMPAPTR